MTAQQMRDKIIDDRNLIFDEEIIDRDFSFSEVKNMATVLVGARRTGKSSYLRLFARKMIDFLGGSIWLPKELNLRGKARILRRH